MSACARMRDIMLPLLLFPVTAPVLVAAVEGTSLALRGAEEGYIHSAFELKTEGIERDGYHQPAISTTGGGGGFTTS